MTDDLAIVIWEAGKRKGCEEALRENKLLYAELARLPTKQAAEAFGRVRAALSELEEEAQRDR